LKGIFVNIRKLGVFFAKLSGPAGCDMADRVGLFTSIRSESDGCGGRGLSDGGGVRSETLDLDPTTQNVRERQDGGERRPEAATGGERRRARRRNPNLGFLATV
jgi:hypothetical protein